MVYGVPYKGSKNRIADSILALLPYSSTLYDVFAGGCAITHCALCSGKYQHVVCSDLDDMPSLFLRAWQGENFSHVWVSREQYFDKYKQDPFIRSLWSFGNKAGHYIYGQSIMQQKHALHNAVVDADFLLLRTYYPDSYEEAYNALVDIPMDDIYHRRLTLGAIIGRDMKSSRSAALENLERITRLRSIYATRTVNSATLEVLQSDYKDMQFNDPNGIIYCDPPYKDTDGYKKRNSSNEFDYEAFYSWCEHQTLPVYISEYSMPDDRFKCIGAFDKNSTVCATKTIAVVERVYRPRTQLKD